MCCTGGACHHPIYSIYVELKRSIAFSQSVSLVFGDFAGGLVVSPDELYRSMMRNFLKMIRFCDFWVGGGLWMSGFGFQ